MWVVWGDILNVQIFLILYSKTVSCTLILKGEECKLHINIVEPKGVLFGVQSFYDNFKNSHILIKIDNILAVTSIYNMGSLRSTDMDKVVQ